MCDLPAAGGDHVPSTLTRRGALIAGAAAATGLALTRSTPVTAAPRDADTVTVMPGLSIHPREAWGADRPPKGPMGQEDVRFLLIHHVGSPVNPDQSREAIRSIYSFHTGSDPTKGWNDVCYNFFVGQKGDVWEGRAGSIAGAVMADATGGSQGFAQLVCLLGDFTTTLPSAAALDSLAKTLAWLSRRHRVSIAEGAETTFVSRGSQRWKAGDVVTTGTIAGHRDMSFTSCPGNQVYQRLPAIREQARAALAAWPLPPAPEPDANGLLPAERLCRVESP